MNQIESFVQNFTEENLKKLEGSSENFLTLDRIKEIEEIYNKYLFENNLEKFVPSFQIINWSIKMSDKSNIKTIKSFLNFLIRQNFWCHWCWKNMNEINFKNKNIYCSRNCSWKKNLEYFRERKKIIENI